jgi:6-phosphogluconolactonase (cycloisomerase 2 family)
VRYRRGLTFGLAGLAALVVLGGAVAAPGGLSLIDEEVDGADGVDGIEQEYGVAVSPDGEYLYAVGLTDNAIATFSRTPSGRLEFVELDRDGEDGVDGMLSPTSLVISPNGRSVYVTGTDDQGTLVTFRRNRQTGALTYQGFLEDGVDGVDGLANACCQTAIAPNGRTVYVAAGGDSAISVFRRNPETGALTFLEAELDGEHGVSGLDGAIGVVVSPNGENVYAIGYGGDASDGSLVTFKRKADGTLRFLNVRHDDAGQTRGLADPCCSLAISPNGRTIYVPGEGDHSIAAFKRSKKTGKVKFLAAYRNGTRGIDGMDDPLDVIVSPDNKSVYVAGYEDNALVTFDRKRSGRLRFRNARLDDTGEITSLGGVWRLAIDPDGRSVYAGAYNDHAVVAFKRRR